MKPKPCTWNGIKYKSINQAARANNITSEAMSWRLKQGYTCDDDMNPPFNRIACEWNGKKYPSQTAAAKANWCTKEAMRWRLIRGYTSDNDLRGAA